MQDQAGRLEMLYNEAINLLPELRHAFLEEQCLDDPGLRHDLEELLDHVEDVPEEFLKSRVPLPVWVQYLA